MSRREDREVQLFRDILTPPDHFEDGFGAKTIVGALFLGLFMLPGSMYLTLFMGQGLGPAARWVTVILFAEVARRSLKTLKQQEVFILFYMTGIALASPFQGLLWVQYLVQSDAARSLGVAAEIPSWVAPDAETIRRTGNTFFARVWLAPILLIGFQLLISRINGFGLGYVLYRLTAHAERLPFPMAPVSAQGVMVLAEEKGTRKRWRWNAFAVGGVLGLAFGFIYVGIPSLTGSLLGTPFYLLPIPWKDLTVSTERFLPATPTNLVFDLTLVILGMVLPFWAVVGGFLGLLVTLTLNPILYNAKILHTWRPGMGLVDTMFSNTLDFYLSFGIGLTLAIFLISIGTMLRPFVKRLFTRGKGAREELRRERSGLRAMFQRNRLRGDIPIWISLFIYVASTFLYIGVSRWLLGPHFNFWFFVIFAFLYTPIISYASAKLEGLVGQTVGIPLVREAAFILSGYRGVAIWFAPIPIVNYGGQTRSFRVVELTGTRVTSLIKTELVTIPVVIIASFLFSQFIWRLGPIPSEAYPFTQEVWRLQALNSCLTYTATMEGGSKFLEAVNTRIIGIGCGLGVSMYALLSLLNMPTFLVFGFIRTLGQTTPGHVLPEMIGALLGRFYFQKRFGVKQWRRIIPVTLAGFTCGVGLMAMASVGVALIAKSISTLLY